MVIDFTTPEAVRRLHEMFFSDPDPEVFE